MEYKSIKECNLDEVIGLWNECLYRDLTNAERFSRHVLFDENFDDNNYLVACDGDKLVGFIYATKRVIPDEIAGLQEGKAWIVAMGVLAQYRRLGIGSKLVEIIQDKFVAQGVKQIDLCCYATNYIIPGIDDESYPGSKAFFEGLGYTEYNKSVSMDIDLHNYKYPKKYKEKKKVLEKQGIRIVPFDYKYSLSMIEFFKKEFPYWMPVCREAIVSGRGQDTVLLALDKDDKTVGYVMRAMDGSDERFGPFGVSVSMQGKSIGSLLFNELMEDMCQKRIFYTYFMWTGGRNIDYYGNWGMKVYRTYHMMNKKYVE